MRALVRDHGGVALRDVPAPTLAAATDVIVDVVVAGLCRTDLRVAAGEVAAPTPLVLGHEFAGVVAAAGERSNRSVGERVACMPFFPCGACRPCGEHAGGDCLRPDALGLTRDGAFAEQVRVPSSALYPLPPGLDWRQAAFAEPVAATLGLLELGLSRDARIAVLGRGRLATLALRALALAELQASPHDLGAPLGADEARYDAAIDTLGDAASLERATALVRPGGTVVLKSRPYAPVPLDVTRCTLRRLRLVGAGYGDLAEGLRLMADGALRTDDLLAEPARLEEHEAVFAAARASEARKPLFEIGA